MDKLKECPDVIYLQACDKCYAKAAVYPDGVTYCEDNIGHECEDPDAKDEVYVKLSRLKEAIEEIDRVVFELRSGERVGWTSYLADGYERAGNTIRKHIPEVKDEYNTHLQLEQTIEVLDE